MHLDLKLSLQEKIAPFDYSFYLRKLQPTPLIVKVIFFMQITKVCKK